MPRRKRRRAARKNPARKVASNPRRRRKKRNPTKARASASNPRRRRRRRGRRNPARLVASNPRRRRRKRRNPSVARASASNPRRRRRRSHRRASRRNPRRSRRNPLPQWASVGLAAILGIGAYALASEGAFALTQRTSSDGTMANLERNRNIMGGILGIGGVAAAVKSSSPFTKAIGIACAAAGAIIVGGTPAVLALGKMIDKPLPGQTGTGSVVRGGLRGGPAMRAIEQGAFPGMGAIGRDPSFGMGAVAAAMVPPWQYRTPLS